MSEFRIIKCKSCGASLVELQGEKIKSCIQCGHVFNQKVKKKVNIDSMIEQVIERQNKNSNPSLPKSGTSNQQNPKTLSQPKNQTKKQFQIPKKPGSFIGTIIKWYIIIFIASKVLQEFI